MSCSLKEMWKKERRTLLQRGAGDNALESVIVLKHTCSDSKVTKLIYAYTKGGWELQHFRCAAYMKGPLISVTKRQDMENMAFYNQDLHFFLFLLL